MDENDYESNIPFREPLNLTNETPFYSVDLCARSSVSETLNQPPDIPISSSHMNTSMTWDSLQIPESSAIGASCHDSKHFQVKWSYHALRVTAFVRSLEGDVSSSDMTIATKDGCRFYAHRLIMVCASAFLKRTLKNVPQDQHVVLVIPKSAKTVASLLKFCYTGCVNVPFLQVQDLLSLAEDYEISGLQSEKNKSTLSQALPSVTAFPSITPSYPFPSSRSRSSSSASSTSPKDLIRPESPFNRAEPKATQATFSFPQQQHKRIRSESDTTEFSKGNLNNFQDSGFCSAAPASSLFNKGFLSRSQTLPCNFQSLVIPRQVSGTSSSRVLLWKFLLDLLHDDSYVPCLIKWLDRSQGVFRIMESDKVAHLWGMARKNNNMTYEKMSRGLRTYYKRGIMYHLDGTKLIYRFNTNDLEIQQQLRYYELMKRPTIDQQTPFNARDFSHQTEPEQQPINESEEKHHPKSTIQMKTVQNIGSTTSPKNDDSAFKISLKSEIL